MAQRINRRASSHYGRCPFLFRQSEQFPKFPPWGWMQLAVGGDLLETYTWDDVQRVRAVGGSKFAPSDKVNPYERGPEMLHELCSRRCLANDKCRGFTMTVPVPDPIWSHQGYYPSIFLSKCALTNEKVKLRKVAAATQAIETFRWYFQRKIDDNSEWHYFPQIDWTSYGYERGVRDSPTYNLGVPLGLNLGSLVLDVVNTDTHGGLSKRRAIAGVDAKHIPRKQYRPFDNINGTAPDRLRELMLNAYHGAYRKWDVSAAASESGKRRNEPILDEALPCTLFERRGRARSFHARRVRTRVCSASPDGPRRLTHRDPGGRGMRVPRRSAISSTGTATQPTTRTASSTRSAATLVTGWFSQRLRSRRKTLTTTHPPASSARSTPRRRPPPTATLTCRSLR